VAAFDRTNRRSIRFATTIEAGNIRFLLADNKCRPAPSRDLKAAALKTFAQTGFTLRTGATQLARGYRRWAAAKP
jgi:hypothetical protein